MRDDQQRGALETGPKPQVEKGTRNLHTPRIPDGCEIYFAPPQKPWLKPMFVRVCRESSETRFLKGGAGFRPSVSF